MESKGTSNPSSEKTSQPLDEEIYWKIIEDSLETNSQDEQEIYLVTRLEKMPPANIIGFRLRTDLLLHQSYTSDMWCAAYLMNGGCSDDCFEYFRCWVISRGKNTFYKAISNPDSLVSELSDEIDFYDFESFWFVALTAFENKTGQDLYDFIDEEKISFGEGKYPEMTFTWKEDDPSSIKVICPELFQLMWR